MYHSRNAHVSLLFTSHLMRPGSIIQHTDINLCHLSQMPDRDSQENFVLQVPTFSQVGFWSISKYTTDGCASTHGVDHSSTPKVTYERSAVSTERLGGSSVTLNLASLLVWCFWRVVSYETLTSGHFPMVPAALIEKETTNTIFSGHLCLH